MPPNRIATQQAMAPNTPTLPGRARRAQCQATLLRRLSAQCRPLEDWIEDSLPAFNYWNQSELTEFFLRPALDALEQIKRERKIFFLDGGRERSGRTTFTGGPGSG